MSTGNRDANANRAKIASRRPQMTPFSTHPPIALLCLVICCTLGDVRSVRAVHSDAVSHALSISSQPMRYGAGRALAREEAPSVSLHKRQPAGSVAELIHELSDSCREVLHKGRRFLAAAIIACSWGWTCVEIQSLWLLQIMRSARGLLLGTKLRNEDRASGSSSWSRLKQMLITNVYCQPIAAIAYMRYAPQHLAAAPVAVTAVITASFRQIYAWMTAKSFRQLYAWMTLSHYPLQVRLHRGSIEALLRLYQGFVKALLRPY